MENIVPTSKQILVITGPTATGKTDLALKLAKRFNGEVVSCDSRQVYIGLDIGTGKEPSRISNPRFLISKHKKYWIIGGVKVWMYDVILPKRQYTVSDYVKEAKYIIEDILKRGKFPIIVGGTGFYLKALLEGLTNLTIPLDKDLRQSLEKLRLDQLQDKLKKISVQKWESLNDSDKKNPRRLVRAIELEMAVKEVKGVNEIKGLDAVNQILKVGLTAPREILYGKVDKRVISRIEQGMIEEGKVLRKRGLSIKRMRELGLEYGIIADYLLGNIKEFGGPQGFIEVLQNKIHQYVRRQLTWFRRDKEISWFDITESGWEGKVEKLVKGWYNTESE